MILKDFPIQIDVVSGTKTTNEGSIICYLASVEDNLFVACGDSPEEARGNLIDIITCIIIKSIKDNKPVGRNTYRQLKWIEKNVE